MKRIIPLLLMIAALAFHTRPAHADDAGPVAAVGAVFYGVEITPAIMAVVDVGSRPTSKTYGGFEVLIGGTAAAMNTYAGVQLAWTGNCLDCRDVAPYVFGVAALDLAVVAHGTYLLVRREPPAKIQITPTVVDEHGTPGLGVAGRF